MDNQELSALVKNLKTGNTYEIEGGARLQIKGMVFDSAQKVELITYWIANDPHRSRDTINQEQFIVPKDRFIQILHDGDAKLI